MRVSRMVGVIACVLLMTQFGSCIGRREVVLTSKSPDGKSELVVSLEPAFGGKQYLLLALRHERTRKTLYYGYGIDTLIQFAHAEWFPGSKQVIVYVRNGYAGGLPGMRAYSVPDGRPLDEPSPDMTQMLVEGIKADYPQSAQAEDILVWTRTDEAQILFRKRVHFHDAGL